MSFQPGAAVYTQAFGTRPENVEVPHIDTRAPGTTDILYPLGKVWVNTLANTVYDLTSQSVVAGVTTSNWTLLGSTGGALSTLSDGFATTVTPVAGNIQIAGTSGQIVTTAGSGVITLSFPSAMTVPGSLTTTTTLAVGTNATVGETLGVTGATTLAALSATTGTFSGTLGVTGASTFTSGTFSTTLGVTGLTTLGALTQVGTTNINATGAALTTIGTGGTGATHIGNATGNTAITGSLTTTTTLTATLGAITATNGNLVLGTLGNKIIVPTGTNASAGTSAVMSGTPGAVTVATTASSATCLIFYSRNVAGGTLGEISITAQSGTGFTLTSTGNETSTFNWWIINA